MCETAVNLQLMKYVLLTRLTKEMAREGFAIAPRVDVSMAQDFLTDQIAVRVIQEVWGEILDEVEHSYPADWWQAFKERWFPAWLLRRYPVKLKIMRLTARAVYPEVSVPHERHRIYLEKRMRAAWADD